MMKNYVKDQEKTNTQQVELSIRDKVRKTEAIYVGYSRFKTLLEKIKYCHEFSKITAEPECLLVTGPTGAGKTTLFNKYLSDFPKEVLETKTKVPILWATIPSPATHKSVVQKLLFELGDPCADSGRDTSSMTIRLNRLIKDCDVEMIILDELQHFIDRDSQRVLKTVSDWFKTLIIDTKVSVILLGLPESELVINANPQLSRRFAHRFSLEPFYFDTIGDQDEFRKFLYAVDKMLPFERLSRLASIDMATRIFIATDGIVGHVMKLIRKGTYIALLWGRDQLELDVLAEAFNLHIQSDKWEKANPFTMEIFSEEEYKKLVANRPAKPKSRASAANRRMNARKPRKEKFSDVVG